MFSIIDLVVGAIGIRITRKYKKISEIPDVVFVKENLAFGGITSYNQLSKFKIDFIMDLRLECPDEIIDKKLFGYEKIGIPDGGIPTPAQINQIEKIVKEKLKSKQSIFIHCNLGRGRATLVTLLFLLHENIKLEDGLKMVKKRRFVYLNKNQFSFLININKKINGLKS